MIVDEMFKSVQEHRDRLEQILGQPRKCKCFWCDEEVAEAQMREHARGCMKNPRVELLTRLRLRLNYRIQNSGRKKRAIYQEILDFVGE